MTDLIPQIIRPSNVLIVGKRFSGKTNVILNIVDPKNFSQIFLLTQTEGTGNLNHLAGDEDFIMNSCSNEFFEELINVVGEMKSGKPIMILIDDFDALELKFMPSFKRIVRTGRNIGPGIGVIYSNQKETEVPTVMRENAEVLWLGKQTDASIEQVAKEFGGVSMSKKKIKDTLRKIGKDNSNDFLYYDDKNADWKLFKGSDMKLLVKPKNN